MLKATLVMFLLLTVQGAPVEKTKAKQKHFVVQKEDISAVEQELKEQAGEDKKFSPTSPGPLIPAMQVDGLADKSPKSSPKDPQTGKHKTADSTNASQLDSDVELSPQDEEFLENIAETLKQHPELLDTLANADSTEIIEEIARIGEKSDRRNSHGLPSEDTKQQLLVDHLTDERSKLANQVGELELQSQLERQENTKRFTQPVSIATKKKHKINDLSGQGQYLDRQPNGLSRHKDLRDRTALQSYEAERELSSLGQNERYSGLRHRVQKKGQVGRRRRHAL